MTKLTHLHALNLNLSNEENEMKKQPSKFETMSESQLRQFIDGCHNRRQYDAMFEQACLVFNSRFR